MKRRSTQSPATRWSMLLLAVLLSSALSGADALNAQTSAPSRKAEKGCTWEKVSNTASGFSAWVQQCDFGNRKIHLFMKGNALMQQYSDGGQADTLVDIVDLNTGETMEGGMQRAFAAHTKPAVSKKCALAPYTEGKEIVGSKRYTFAPNAAFAKELARIKSTDIPDPPCGDWGAAPDGIQYFQVLSVPGVRKFLFVRVGQDLPLFDERTLQLVAPVSANSDRKP